MFRGNGSNQYFYIDMDCPITSYPFTIYFDRYWTGEGTVFGFGWCENAPATPYKTIRIQNGSVSASKGRQQLNIGGTVQTNAGYDVLNTYSKWVFNPINTTPGNSNLYRNNTTRLTSLQTSSTFATLPITGLTRFWIGYGPWSTTTYLGGWLGFSNITVWNKTLSLDEINSLMKGICPIKVAPSNIRFYLPLNDGPHANIEWISGKSVINVNGMSSKVTDPPIFYDGKRFLKNSYGSIEQPPSQNIQYGSTTFYINNNIYTPSFLNMYGSLEFRKDSIIHSSYNRIMNGRIDLPNDIIISSSSNKVINGVGIFSGNVDISTTYKRIMNGNSVLSSITKLSDFPSLIINPQLSFQNKNSITGIGNILINGGTIPLNTSSDLNLTIQRILNPNLIMDTTSTTDNVGSLIMEGYSSLNSNTNISPSTTRIMSSVIDLMNDGRLDNNSYITMNAVQKFINEENLTIIPSLIFNSRVGIENTSELGSVPTRIISGNQTIQSKSSIQNICSLIMSGTFGADNDSMLDGVLTPVDTGETLLGTSILQTLSHLGLNASLRMEGSTELSNNLNTFLSSNRIILPVVELRNNTSIESNPHSIINSVVDMEAFGRLSPASQRIINGRFEVGSEGRIIGNSSRIIQSELELNAYTEFLNSSTRIHTGMLVLSNDSSFDSVGNRVISGVMVYDVDSYINSTGQSVLTGQLNLQTSTLLDSSIIKLVFIPFTMNICREYDINLQNSTTNTFQFSINREKEIVLNIRK